MCIVEIHDRDIIFFPNFTIKKTMARIKANEDQDFCFCGSPEKSRLECLNRGVF